MYICTHNAYFPSSRLYASEIRSTQNQTYVLILLIYDIMFNMFDYSYYIYIYIYNIISLFDTAPFICKSIYIQTTQHIIYNIHTICIYVHVTFIFHLPVYMPPRSAAPRFEIMKTDRKLNVYSNYIQLHEDFMALVHI